MWHKRQGHQVPLVSGEDLLGRAGVSQHRNNNNNNGVAAAGRRLGVELNSTLLFRLLCHLGSLLV